MRGFFLSSWKGYAVALLALAAALALRGVLDPWLGSRVPFVTVFGAIIFSVWYGGVRPAVLVAVLGYFAAVYWFMEPRGAFGIVSFPVTIALVAYFLSSALIVALGGAMHAARKSVEFARTRLEESDQRFRAFMNHSPDCVFIKDEMGRYVFMNRTAERILGIAEADWRGRTDAELLPAEAARAIEAHDREVLAADAPFVYDISVARPQGTRDFHSTKFPLRDASGRRYVGSVSTDVTERTRSAQAQERTEEALRATRERLQIVTDTMPVAVTWTGRDLRYRWVNPQFAKWLKRAPEEIAGHSLDEILDEGVLSTILPYVQRALAGEQVQYERVAHLPGLGPRWIQMVLTPTYGADRQVDGWVAAGVDIHDRKVADEEMKAADRRKDEFLAVLAHELRNPLAPIRNALAILGRKGGDDPEIVWSREVIDRQVGQMTRLVDDLLDIERISRGKLLVRKERVPLERVVDMALETSRPPINSAGHRLSVVLPSEQVILDADPARLAQAFSNLLINAAKYTEPRGSISVSAQLEGNEAVISVEDTGIGFGPELASSLFKPFTQLTAGQERSVGGLGIGLSLVQGIVALHGGSVSAQSAGPGEGSRFTIRLPVAGLVAEEAQSAKRGGADAEAQEGFRVLVADDNKDAADSLQRILSFYGHQVRVAYDGPSALELEEAFRPRIAVLDIGMPGSNGYEVARVIRARQGGRVTLIAVTGWGQEADRRRAIDAGFDYHLTKPVDPAVLNELLLEAGTK